MSAISIQPTYPIFTDIDGQPLEAGYVWIGQANLDPQVNPINVYWDAALTISAPQPIRTLGGYPSRNGTPARLYVNSDYSIRVMNRNGSSVYSAADGASDRFSSAQVSFLQAGTGAVSRSVQSRLRETVSVKDFGAIGDDVADDTVAIQNAINTGRAVFFPSGVYRITAPLTSTGNDFILIGETYDVFSEKNNEEDNFTGSVINYFGPDNGYVIDPVNNISTNQICLKNITIVAAKTHSVAIVRLRGNGLTGLEYHAEATIQDVRIETRDFNVSGGALDGYTATGLLFDCTGGWFWGCHFSNIYLFGLQRGIIVEAPSGFFNSNTFTNIKLYQVWRALYLNATAPSEIKANLFDGFYVQPNAQGGVWADGVIWLNGNVAQNVFVAPNVYDVPLGTGTEFRSTTSFDGSGRWFENVFVGPMCNNIYNGRIGSGYFVGWGQNSFGQTAASSLSLYAADPTINTTATLQSFIDQNTGTARYPRNGVGNDYAYFNGGAAYPSFYVDGLTGVFYASGGFGVNLVYLASASTILPNRVGAAFNTYLAGAATVTLPSPTLGRTIRFSNQVAQQILSASSNVYDPVTSSTTNVICSNVIGSWTDLIGDGSNWIIFARG